MRVVVDTYIPFLQDALTHLGMEVVALEPAAITYDTVRDAEALFVRTRTHVDAQLLDNTAVRFVATATIGTDHIDDAYLDQKGIFWTSAPGCNAQAVCDYVEESIAEFLLSRPTPADTTNIPVVGIIGCGHVGSKVHAMVERKGWKTLINDPLKGYFTDLETIASTADIITFHTPLTLEGQYKTYHLCDAAFLAHCRPHTLIINAARGGIVDEQALLSAHTTRHISYILDTWENEPNLQHNVLQHALGASYHIAGYSIEGKINASQQVLDAFCRFFQFAPCVIDKKAVSLQADAGDSQCGWIQRITQQLKAQPEDFELLRKHYALR